MVSSLILSTLLLAVPSKLNHPHQISAQGAESPGSESQVTGETPKHLAVARDLVQKLKGSGLNVYGGGKREIAWEASPATARTVCSSFETLLLQHTYHLSDQAITNWFGLVNPKASDYHDEIVNGNRFRRILRVEDLRPGDYLAIRFYDGHENKKGAEDTGHVMLVDEAPHPMEAVDPIVSGTTQFSIRVVDSSASGHGKEDTRHLPSGGYSGGIGIGNFRIYANSSGEIAGCAWSTSPKSEFFHAPDRNLVAGRLKLSQNRPGR